MKKDKVLENINKEMMSNFTAGMFVGLTQEGDSKGCYMCATGIPSNIIEAFVMCAENQKSEKDFLIFRDILYNAVFNIMSMEPEYAQDFFQMLDNFVEDDEGEKGNATIVNMHKKS